MKLALGTAQFGLNYGVANQHGQITKDEGARILAIAAQHGIDTLDTAIAYGDSERALGQIGVAGWRIVSKLPAVPAGCSDVGAWVDVQIHGSLERLGVDRLHALMLHRPEQLFAPEGPQLLAALRQLKERRLVAKIGVSVYSSEELARLFDLAHFDIVQAPMSILDRRLITSGWVERLKRLGIELHTRSAFLQGLLLMAPEERPAKLRRFDTVWNTWDEWLHAHQVTPLQACLRYALSIDGVDRVLVGVDSAAQLNEILETGDQAFSAMPAWPEVIDPMLLNPAYWSQL